MSHTLEHIDRNGIDVVRLPKQLIMANAPDTRTQLRDLIEHGGGRLVVDLSQTEFMDSSGLSVMVNCLQAARAKEGGNLLLCGMNADIAALFELTRLHTVFDLYDDETSALHHFQNPS